MSSERELRVLFVLSTLGLGGAEVWVMALLEYFAANRSPGEPHVTIDICLTSGRTAYFDDRARELGAKLFYLEYSRRKMPSFIEGFRKILDQGRYDVIHDHQDYHAGWHFLAGARHLPPKRVVHLHNTYRTISSVQGSTVARRATLKAGKHLVSSLATDVLGTSRQVLEDYGFVGTSPRSLVVHCGFNVRRFAPGGDEPAQVRRELGLPVDSKVMLFVGRLDGSFNQKNHPFAFEVAAALAGREADVRLLVAGGGDAALEEAIRTISARGLDDSIRFLGQRDDVPRLMKAADILLFPSIAEGLGMVAVEAQAAGLRVLASDSIPRECEVVPGAVTFMPLGRGAGAWADCVQSLLTLGPAPRAAWNAEVASSPFSIDWSADALVEAYSSGSFKS